MHDTIFKTEHACLVAEQRLEDMVVERSSGTSECSQTNRPYSQRVNLHQQTHHSCSHSRRFIFKMRQHVLITGEDDAVFFANYFEWESKDTVNGVNLFVN
jgi:hypothetical protein